MKGNMKRGLSVVLAAVLAFSFTGCGKKTSSGTGLIDQAATMSKDYVFKAEEFKADGLPEDIGRLSNAGDRIYVTDYSQDDYIEVLSFNYDGSDRRSVKLPLTDSDNTSSYYQDVCADKDGNVYSVLNLYHYSEDDMVLYDEGDPGEDEIANGEMIEGTETTKEVSEEVTEEPTEESEEASEEASEESSEDADEDGNTISDEEGESDEYYLVKYDKDGNLVYKEDLVAKFSGDEPYFNVNDLCVTDDGVVLLCIENQVVSYTEDTGFKEIVGKGQGNDYNYYEFQKGFNGQMFVTYYGDNGVCLSTFDVATGKIGEPSKAISGYGDFAYFGGSGYDLYISDEEAIYGYDLASDSKTKLLDYVDSDLELTGSTNQAVAISDVEFIVCLSDEDGYYKAYRLTKVAPEDVQVKKIITLGGYYVDYDVRRQVSAFNKNNNEYKIKIVDYSSYDEEGESYGTGSDKLNMDIVSGNVPDIILISNQMPVDSFINKGLFQDLTPYFEKDPDISESDLLTNIYDAFKVNGKSYQVVPSFQIGTMAVKTKFTDGKDVLSFDDCKKLIEQTGVNKQKAFGYMTRETFLDYGLRFAGNNYIDWENKTCHFDGDAFVDFLEFSSEFMEEIPESAYDDYKDTMYVSEESLFSITILNTFRSFNENTQAYFGGDVSYVGYPNDFGVNNSIIYPTYRFGISAQSKNKDAAWDFVKTFYSDKFQESVYEFPIKKSVFEKRAKDATERPYYMDGDEKVYYDEYTYIGGEDTILRPMTQEEVTEVVNYIKSLSLVFSNNESVNKIIFEEASAYYSGQKSAKEVADIIQSRVSIYVNENS